MESVTWEASAELHAGSAGSAVLLQPAAARSDHIRNCTAVRRFMPASALVPARLWLRLRCSPAAARCASAPSGGPAVAQADARTSFRTTSAPTSTSPYMHTISGPVGRSPSSEIHRPRIEANAPEPQEM